MNPSPSLTEPGDLRGFPGSSPPARLVRVCRVGAGTWWYSSDGSGRFDLPHPEGTCYLATDSCAAIREASRLGPVAIAWVHARELREVKPPNPEVRLAATSRTGAGRYGVTAELVTVVPYDLPRRWAAAFRAHSFGGIRHQLRHDQRSRSSGVALFGPAGAATLPAGAATLPAGAATLPAGAATLPAGAATLEDRSRTPLTITVVEAAGVDVYPPPTAAEVTIVT